MTKKLTLTWHTFPLEDLHMKEGTIHIGVDHSVNDIITTVVAFKEKETGVVYIISTVQEE